MFIRNENMEIHPAHGNIGISNNIYKDNNNNNSISSVYPFTSAGYKGMFESWEKMPPSGRVLTHYSVTRRSSEQLHSCQRAPVASLTPSRRLQMSSIAAAAVASQDAAGYHLSVIGVNYSFKRKEPNIAQPSGAAFFPSPVSPSIIRISRSLIAPPTYRPPSSSTPPRASK